MDMGDIFGQSKVDTIILLIPLTFTVLLTSEEIGI